MGKIIQLSFQTPALGFELSIEINRIGEEKNLVKMSTTDFSQIQTLTLTFNFALMLAMTLEKPMPMTVGLALPLAITFTIQIMG